MHFSFIFQFFLITNLLTESYKNTIFQFTFSIFQPSFIVEVDFQTLS